jgi:hypothetical protein
MIAKKKMGRPAGVKNKAPASFKDVRAEGKLHAEDEPVQLNMDEQRLAQLIEQRQVIQSLEHQAIGYRAVISYLEHTIASTVDK